MVGARRRAVLAPGLTEELDGNVVLNGHPTERLPNTLNGSFPGWCGDSTRLGWRGGLDGFCLPLRFRRVVAVLRAMRVAPETGMGAIRFNLGRTTTEEEIEAVVTDLKTVLA